MPSERTATVLIAEPTADAKRNDDCRKLVEQAVISTADSTGGLLLSDRGGKMILRFATPDAAASAASKIHAALDEMRPVAGIRPGVQIGFHTGPVAHLGSSVADETVSLAVKLAEKAQEGQTVTSQETLQQLNPAFRGFSRSLLSLQDETRICELSSWHQKRVRPPGWQAMAVLRLSWRNELVMCSRERDTIVVGREDGCDVVIVNDVTSRRHCTVRYRDGNFALFDHSRNGTYLTVNGKSEVQLKRGGVLLPEQGTIAIGQPRARGGEILEFGYALVT